MSEPIPPRPMPSLLMEWLGVLLAPAVWTYQFFTNYGLVGFVPQDSTRPIMHAISIAGGLGCLIGAAIAWRNLGLARAAIAEPSMQREARRVKTMSLLGLSLAALLVLVTAAQWLAVLLLETSAQWK